MANRFTDNIRVGQQKPLDDKYFNGLSPYTSVEQVHSLLPLAIRHRGLKVNVNGVEYWFKDGIQDEDLVLYTTGSGGGGGNVEWDNINNKPTEFNPAPHQHSIADVENLQGELNNKISSSEKGANNGIATLDNNGKVPISQISVGVFIYKGVWDATTNTPELEDGVGTNGWLYKVNGAGTVDFGSGNITFEGGEYVRYNEAGVWEKDTNPDTIVSVNGQTGEVLLRFQDLVDIPDTSVSGGKILAAKSDGTGLEFIDVPSGIYAGASPATISLGGVPSGFVLTGKTYEQIIEKLLVVYQNPAFSSFSIQSQPTIIEVGTTLSGNKTFIWSTTNNANIQANSLRVRDVTANAVIASSMANDGSETIDIGTIDTSSAMSRSWRIEATNTQSGEFQSAGFTVSTVYPVFYMKSNTPISKEAFAAAIESGGATKIVTNSSGTITIPFNASGEYLAVAHVGTSTTKTVWYVSETDWSYIPGGVFAAAVTQNVNSPDGYWSNITYKMYITSGLITQPSPIQLRNSK